MAARTFTGGRRRRHVLAASSWLAVALSLGLGASWSLDAANAYGTQIAAGARQPRTPAVATPTVVVPRPFGYDLVEADGAVTAVGGAVSYGSVSNTSLVAPIVALLPTPDRKGYWLIGADGSVFPFGDARAEGGAGGKVRADPVVGAAASAGGLGYWLVTASGKVMAFGDARSYGSIGVLHHDRAVAIVATPDGRGYWIACRRGGVFPFGDAKYHGSMAGRPMDHFIVAMAATADGGGYWLAGAGGEIFHFGDAVNLEPPTPVTTRSPFVGIAVDSSGTGAWTAKQDGVVLNFGTAVDHGSLGVAPASRVTAIAAMPIPSAGTGRPLGYVLAEADGTVSTLGGATDYGSRSSTKLVAPIVALLPTPDRRGYWLIGADGSVFPFGDAAFEGAAGGEVRADPVVGAAATTDGGGYWLVTAGGNVLPFGDARSYGSIETPLDDPVVAIAVTPDGGGYWLASRSGRVFNLGDARNYGFLGGHLASPVVAMAVTPDGRGYWLAEAGGAVFAFGDAETLPPATTVKPTSPAVGMAVTGNGSGAWLAESNGTVLPLGTATAHRSASVPPASRVVSIAAMPAVAGSSYLRYPKGSFGYDINWPQCAGPRSPRTVPLPGPPNHPSGTVDFTVAVVGVDGWAIGSQNPCLRAEVQWAEKARKPKGSPYDLYIFLNSPSSSDTIDLKGPAGTCARFSGTRQESCLAYNYGYNSARIARQYAVSQGAASPMWWLDIENDLCGQYWSCHPALNARTIQGALDFLHAHKLTVGIYSTSVQWQGITGGYVPHGPQVPIWVAGAFWTSPPYPANYDYYPPSKLAPYCGGQYGFAGGKTWLLQETPGPNNYPFDPDYAC